MQTRIVLFIFLCFILANINAQDNMNYLSSPSYEKYKMTLKAIRKLIYSLVVITLIFIYIYCVAGKLAGGARWSSGLPLGGVDNFLYENGSLYTTADKGFTPGSSYFPGTVLLSLFFRILFGYGAETGIISFGALTAFFAFWGFARIASDNKKKRFWLAVLAAVFFVVEFPYARMYLLELHPDIPALTFFLWGIIALDHYLKKGNILFLVLVTLLFWISGLFKQNAAALYIGLGFYVLFSKSISLKNKVSIILTETLAGIATLAVVFSIDGCWYNCVTVNSLHPLLSLKEYLIFGYSTCRSNLLFIFSAFVFLILLITKNIHFERQIEKLWFSASIGWILFCMYGAAKDGANDGNMEAAIIAFMPFVLLIIQKAFIFAKNHIDVNGLLCSINEMKHKDNLKALVCSILIFVFFRDLGLLAVKTKHEIIQFKNRIAVQKEFSNWLTENYKGKNIAYNAINYELLNDAEIKKTTDFYTFYVWKMGNLVSDEDLKAISEKESWDLIIAWPGLDDARFPITFGNFRRLPQSEYPDVTQFYGNPVEVFVRK